jgi:hypothetical protein
LGRRGFYYKTALIGFEARTPQINAIGDVDLKNGVAEVVCLKIATHWRMTRNQNLFFHIQNARRQLQIFKGTNFRQKCV